MAEDRAPSGDGRRRPAGDPALRALIRQAQRGSREAYDALRGRYRPLVESSVSRFAAGGLTRQEREDLREEAEAIFLSALSSYDAERETADFGLYAKICLRNGLVSALRRRNARSRLGSEPLPEDCAAPAEDPAALLAEEEGFRRLCLRVRACLSAYENRVWWAYVSGAKVPAIAAALGREEKSIHNAIYRIRRKLRALLAPDASRPERNR